MLVLGPRVVMVVPLFAIFGHVLALVFVPVLAMDIVPVLALVAVL